MLKKRRRKIKRVEKKQSHKNYKENIGTKLITNTKKQNYSAVWNFKNTMLKKKEKKKEKKQTNKNKQGRENYKKNIGTRLMTNTKKQKLKI